MSDRLQRLKSGITAFLLPSEEPKKADRVNHNVKKGRDYTFTGTALRTYAL